MRNGLAIACMGLLWAANGFAAIDICSTPAAQSYFSYTGFSGGKSELDGGYGQVELEHAATDVLFRFDNGWSAGAGHRYSIFTFDALEPQTNGHLHTLFFPLHRRSESGDGRFRFSVAPALAASSNVMKDPGEYDIDTLQILGALVWSRSLSGRMDLRYGVCADHRFGNYRLYPLLSFDWRPHEDWTFEAGFPVLGLHYQATTRLGSSLRFTPGGNEWYVKDKSLQNASQFVYESYLLQWTIDWQVTRKLSVDARVGRHFRNRYEMTLLDGSRVRLAGEPFTRAGLGLTWRF